MFKRLELLKVSITLKHIDNNYWMVVINEREINSALNFRKTIEYAEGWALLTYYEKVLKKVSR